MPVRTLLLVMLCVVALPGSATPGRVRLDDQVWVPIAVPSPAPDRGTHVTVYDQETDQIFQVGGSETGAPGSYDGLNRAYDPKGDIWATKAPMPTPLGLCGYAVVRGRLYLIGGHNNAGGFVATNQEYDIAANTWATKAPRPGTAVAAPLSATWRDSLIYVMGGLATAAVNRVDVYDPATNTWAAGTALPRPAFMGSAAVIGDTIYIAQAYDGSACWTHFYKGAIAPANPTSINWIQGPALTDPVFSGATVAVGNKVYWMCGYINAATPTGRVWQYSQATGEVTEFEPSYPAADAWGTFAAARVTPRAHEVHCMAGNRTGSVYVKLVLWSSGVQETPAQLQPGFVSVRPSVIRDRAKIDYSLSRPGPVHLGVYDASGRLVRTLVSGVAESGTRTATWDRRDRTGRTVPGGTYFYRLSAEGRTSAVKTVVTGPTAQVDLLWRRQGRPETVRDGGPRRE